MTENTKETQEKISSLLSSFKQLSESNSNDHLPPLQSDLKNYSLLLKDLISSLSNTDLEINSLLNIKNNNNKDKDNKDNKEE